ncbi:MAG TPA: hybrid sensor histidine kinase/response regulator, partial [Bacteroidales bacterium]|nr:hybrid sensor histidine kinase/response regulator [Bacteroidales bacterium]
MIEILLIEDNTDDVELIKYRLKTDGFDFKIRHVLSLEQLAETLSNGCPDVILSDFNLRGFTALDALEFVRLNYPKIPFIVVTGSIDEETVAFTIKSGAWDYVVKERLFRLSTAIKAAIERFNENRRTEQVENKLQILSIAIQQASTSVIITDREGNVEFANKKFTEISGYTDSDFLTEKVNILKSGLLSEKEYKEIWETVISGSQWKGEFQNRTKTGELYWVLAS